jgi:hypothetical protein
MIHELMLDLVLAEYVFFQMPQPLNKATKKKEGADDDPILKNQVFKRTIYPLLFTIHDLKPSRKSIDRATQKMDHPKRL